MPRPLRIHVVDGWYHVMSRGNGGEDIYRREEDRRRLLGLISELPERFGTEVHAFVLMDNYYHLLVQCRRGTLSETLRWLQTTYAVRFIGRHRRRGHLFHRDDSQNGEGPRAGVRGSCGGGAAGASALEGNRARIRIDSGKALEAYLPTLRGLGARRGGGGGDAAFGVAFGRSGGRGGWGQVRSSGAGGETLLATVADASRASPRSV